MAYKDSSALVPAHLVTLKTATPGTEISTLFAFNLPTMRTNVPHSNTQNDLPTAIIDYITTNG